MKFNWGTGVVLAFIGFISFIMYFVITYEYADNKFDHDLGHRRLLRTRIRIPKRY